MNLFRNLTESEIEVRRGRSVGQDKVELLLYKTARTDMNLLDETFGCFGWAVQYKEEKGILFCGLGIKDPESKVWIWRWNAGAEGNFEAEKSVASDSMKRAGFLFGLGRELYTAPRVIVKPDNQWTQYYVRKIGYDERDRINELVIADERGKVVYDMNGGGVVKQEPKTDRVAALKAFCRQKADEGESTYMLKKFHNFYEGKIPDWQTEPDFERLLDKWKERE